MLDLTPVRDDVPEAGQGETGFLMIHVPFAPDFTTLVTRVRFASNEKEPDSYLRPGFPSIFNFVLAKF